jgi:POT family proton-dependent oligopeptide transporter
MSDERKADAKAKMPSQIPLIIASEGCERFSFYGMRNILTNFLVSTLLLRYVPEQLEREAAAKEVFHTFVMGVYFFPLLGGWLADRFFGKYRTILWFSLIYCVGHGCLAVFEDSVNGFYTGLFLISLGAGGIKPLVASFVGDQFDDTNKHLAKRVFDMFYWIINFGSFFASLLMPLFLDAFGASIAFGIPGALMLIATIVLWLGRHRYVMVPVAARDPHSFTQVVKTALFSRTTSSLPQAKVGGLGGGVGPSDSRPGLVVACFGVVVGVGVFGLFLVSDPGLVPIICTAVVAMIAFLGIGTWMQLDRARAVHGDEAVEGVRAVFRVLVVFALVTPFHSLFDQKATTWVLQGGNMHSPAWEFDLGGRGIWELKFSASQMQALNPLLVMILIPFNNAVLYPFLRRRGWEPTSLRRMTVGLAFAGFAWVAAGIIQLMMDGHVGADGKIADAEKISIMWQILPYVLLTFAEVLVSATGLEFAYSQAPLAMKSVIMSFWNLTTTIGNLWVLIVNETIRNDSVLSTVESTGLSQTAFLMFFFAVFAFLTTIVFKLYVRRYQVRDVYRAAT